MSAIISLEGLKFHAYHGVHPQERIVGGMFMVDIHLSMHIPAEGFRDDLHNTIDYERVYAVIAEVMREPKYLIETLAEEVITKLFDAVSLIQTAHIIISKMHPPVGGECLKSKIELKRQRPY
jgi:dihydroneopterin aldolase